MAGKLRPLAVTSATRWEGLPDIPTVGDFVPGYEASSVFGLGAPKKTPVEIIDKLNREINAGLDDHGWSTSAARCLRAHLPTSGSSWQTTPRSGAR
jgi:tripartite-type tricarboxylate transporter receptor subunit TctC